MRPIHLLTLVAIIAACLLPTAAIAQNTSAISLLAQHKAYVGWQMGDNTIRSLILDGSISKMPDGSEPTYSVHAAYEGLAHRRTLTRTKDGTKTDNGFTGRVFWRSNENGFVHPETGDLQKYDISSDVLFGEGTTGFSKAEVRGNKTVDGVATTIVRIQPDPGFPIDLYLDPANGAYKRAVIDPDGAFETTVDILAYSDALPVTLASTSIGPTHSPSEATRSRMSSFKTARCGSAVPRRTRARASWST